MPLESELAVTARKLSALLARERALGVGKPDEGLVAEKEALLAELEAKGLSQAGQASAVEAEELGRLLSDAYMANALSERALKVRVKLNELGKARPESFGTSRVNIVS